jgi:hypothetical protein
MTEDSMIGNDSAKPIYRVDKFVVPASARDEFLARANTIRDVLKRQEGFVRDSYLEQISGLGEFNIVTIRRTNPLADR